MSSDDNSIVVFVHGLWVNGMELGVLRYLVKRRGFQSVRFSYRSVKYAVQVNAERLAAFIWDLPKADKVHLVGHSLGGLVILKMFDEFEDIPPGRVVLMGSPVRGSQAARRLQEIPWGPRLLGKSAENGLTDTRELQWDGSRDLGIIAGTHLWGIGYLVKRLAKPNDGTVTVEETKLKGASDFVTFPVTHTSMAFSRDVADAITCFIRNGRFSPSLA